MVMVLKPPIKPAACPYPPPPTPLPQGNFRFLESTAGRRDEGCPGHELTFTMISMASWFPFLLSPKDLTLKEQSLRARAPCRASMRSSREARRGEARHRDIFALLVLLAG